MNFSKLIKYNTIISNTKPGSLDLYCIDFNGIIHNVAQDIIKKYNGTDKAKHNNDIIEQEIIEGVWARIKYYIENYKASQYIICADGVAPLAKMFQQRKRRYLNIYKNLVDALGLNSEYSFNQKTIEFKQNEDNSKSFIDMIDDRTIDELYKIIKKQTYEKIKKTIKAKLLTRKGNVQATTKPHADEPDTPGTHCRVVC